MSSSTVSVVFLFVGIPKIVLNFSFASSTFPKPQSEKDKLLCLLFQPFGVFSYAPLLRRSPLEVHFLVLILFPLASPVPCESPALRFRGGKPSHGEENPLTRSHCIRLCAFLAPPLFFWILLCFFGSSSFLAPGIPLLSCTLVYTFKGITFILLEQEAFEVPLAHHVLGSSRK